MAARGAHASLEGGSLLLARPCGEGTACELVVDNSMASPNISTEERDARDALATVLEERSADIIERWIVALTKELPLGEQLPPSDLRDGIDEYLAKLAQTLRSERPIVPGGESAWKDVAREHAVTRIRQGFDVSGLVHEFFLLRRVILGLVAEKDTPLLAEQAAIIADLVGAAVADAVASYVEARDYAARKAETEHVAFITHELRNPLSAAMNAVTRLAAQPEVIEAAQPVLALLQRSLGRLSQLIDRVLEIERLDSGELAPKPVELPLGRLMDESLQVARENAERKGLQFRADFQPNTMMFVDAQLSTSAVQNVVDNAVKFTDAGMVHVTCEERADHVVVHVRNDCSGLSQAEIETIFQPFHRGHTHQRGSGLGLAIARRSIEAQGGTIGVESPEDHGCHFWLTLPKAAA
jgi:signal transduction histidine kinase